MSTGACDWSAVAASWDRHRDDIEAISKVATDAFLSRLDIRPGERVLELGSGNGELATHLAELVGPDGHLTASDVADAMVELTRSRTAGRANVDVRRLDATAIDAPADSFDVVVFRMGLMLTADPDAALLEIRRVLRPGGRLAAAVWGDAQHNPWMVSVGMAAMMHGLVQGPPPNSAGGPLSLGDPDELEKRARNAGFGHVQVDVLDYTRRYAGPDEHFDMVRTLAPPIAAACATAAPEQLAAVRATVHSLTEQYRDGDALVLPARALVCVTS